MCSFLIIYRFFAVFMKGAILINQQNSKLADLSLYKDKDSFVSGVGKEMKLLKILSMDAGEQLMNFTMENARTGIS